MKLRIVSAVLWFLAGWFVVGLIAFHVGLNQGVAPLVGLAWASLVMIDPKHLIWGVGTGSAKASRELGAVGEHEKCREIATKSAEAIEVSRA